MTTISRLQDLLSSLPPLKIPQTLPFSLVEFTLFPKLPPELRDKIWTYAAQEPRIIVLQEVENYDWISTRVATKYNVWSSDVAGQTRHPGIMQACRESRHKGGEFYKKRYEFAQEYSYAEDYPQRSSDGCEGNAIFINFNIDRFELRRLNPY